MILLSINQDNMLFIFSSGNFTLGTLKNLPIHGIAKQRSVKTVTVD
jgi:hypothetical protein